VKRAKLGRNSGETRVKASEQANKQATCRPMLRLSSHSQLVEGDAFEQQCTKPTWPRPEIAAGVPGYKHLPQRIAGDPVCVAAGMRQYTTAGPQQNLRKSR